jgi:putative ABC transport system permease protein
MRHAQRYIFRSLRQHPGFTLVSVGGFAIGLLAVMILGIYIIRELSYDDHHHKAKQIVVLNNLFRNGYMAHRTSAPVAPAIAGEYPGVEAWCRIDGLSMMEAPVRVGDKLFTERFIGFADSTLFRFFDYKLLLGDPRTALTAPRSIVITETVAQRYFGNENPLGRTVILNNDTEYIVTGVRQNDHRPTHLPDFPIIGSFSSLSWRDDGNFRSGQQIWSYLLLRDGFGLSDFPDADNTDLITPAGTPISIAKSGTHAYGQYLTDIHLGSTGIDTVCLDQTTPSMLWVLGTIGGLIILIAAINYMNLLTARNLTRTRYVGICKSLGASRSRLFRLFITENVLIVLVAYLMSLVLLELLLPTLVAHVDLPLTFSFQEHVPFLAVLAMGCVLLAVATGLYPGLLLTSFEPVRLLRGKIVQGGKPSFHRSILVVVQFTIAIALIGGTFVIQRQLRYLHEKPLGYQSENLMALRLSASDLREKWETIVTRLEQLPGVTSVAMGDNPPYRPYWWSGFYFPQTEATNSFSMCGFEVGAQYLDVLGIELLQGEIPIIEAEEGRHARVIINESAAKLFSAENPIGEEVLFTSGESPYTFEVVGVVRDFHIQSMRYTIEPSVLLIKDESPGFLFIRMDGNQIASTHSGIIEIWKDYAPDAPFEGTFVEDVLAREYGRELRLGRLLNLFSSLAIGLALLGLVALAAYDIQRRVREIAIRKVLGATTASIIRLRTTSFALLILSASIVAIPIAYTATDKWLDHFAYRAGIDWWLFPIAGGLALFVAVLITGTLVWRTAKVNPAISIRQE